MNNHIPILVEMQKLDDVIAEKLVLTESLPKRLSGLKKDVEDADNQVSETKTRLEENRKDQKLKELEIKSNNDQITKYKNQLLAAQSNKEYKALNSEVAHLENQNSLIDDVILQLMEDESSIKAQLEEELKIQANAKAELKANEDSLNLEIKEVEKEIKKFRDQRNNLAKDLPRALVKRYAALIKNRNRKAVVFNNGNKCGGCGYVLRPQVMIELQKGDEIINCENCGRMLVFHE